MIFKYPKPRLLAAVLCLCLPAPLFAASSTTSFGTSATVANSCSVTATDLAFGQITPVDGTNFDATSTVDVTCSNGTAYDIGLDAGANASTPDDVSTRRMIDSGGTNYLSYQLYSDSGYSTVWGNTVSTDTVTSTGNGTTQSHTVYGRVPSGQETAPTGGYTDTINVTVSY